MAQKIEFLSEYPVTIDSAGLKNARGIDLAEVYSTDGERYAFLMDLYAAIYDGCIYATGDRTIKNEIIAEYKEKVMKSIQRALVIQAAYMLDEGNAGTASGITITADGQKAVVTKDELRSKTICPAALDALKACAYPILYAGE